MDWARVMRGISSMANAVTLRAASARIRLGLVVRLQQADHDAIPA